MALFNRNKKTQTKHRMIRSTLKVAFRNAKKKPFYTFINFAGLITGVACFTLISLYVWDELQMDSHQSNAEQIIRVDQTTKSEDSDGKSAKTPFPLRDVLIGDYSSYINSGVRLFDLDSEHVALASPETQERYRHGDFLFSDPGIEEIFDIRVVRGANSGFLDEPGSVVITERVAELYFGNDDPVGQELILEGRISLTVTAVMEEWDRRSHFRPSVIVDMESLRGMWGNYDMITSRWRWNAVWTYLKMEPGADPEGLERQLPDIVDTYYGEYFSDDEEVTLSVIPLKNIWLHSEADSEIGQTGSYRQIWLFGAVGFLILIIACINFINLSTAQSILRAREVGVRKTLGAERGSLMKQFITESTLFTGVAVTAGLAVAWLAYPYLATFAGREFGTLHIGTLELILATAVLVAGVSLISGFYPSAVLSSLKPIRSLRGGMASAKGGATLRKGLTLFQFTVTALLLIGTAMVYVQYSHLQERDLGFDQDRVIVIPVSMTTAIWYYDEFRDQALTHSGIENVSGSRLILGGEDFLNYQVIPEGYGEGRERSFPKLFVKHDFVETMGIQMSAGRSFSRDFSTDPQESLMINEAMVERMGWGTPAEAIGRTFQVNDHTMTVVGVTRDFNHTYLRRELEPLIMQMPGDTNQMIANISYMKVRLSGGSPGDAIQHLESVWNEFDNTHPFEFFYLDERLTELYGSERRLTTLLTLFAIFAIAIASLGLLGLGSYTLQTRSREVAIRKTLGATEGGIFMLLSKDTLKIVAIAHMVALPPAWYLASRWFESFPYQVSFGYYFGLVVLLSLFLTTTVAFLTIGTQTWRAAYRDPIESLRSE